MKEAILNVVNEINIHNQAAKAYRARLAAEIKLHRENTLKLSQREVGRLLGCSHVFVGDVEGNRRAPPVSWLEKFLAIEIKP